MTDIKQYLEETNTVLLTKESFEYLKEKAIALDKIRAEIEKQLLIGRIVNHYEFDNGLKWCLEIIDKYR